MIATALNAAPTTIPGKKLSEDEFLLLSCPGGVGDEE
jgi:hypothetical protein